MKKVIILILVSVIMLSACTNNNLNGNEIDLKEFNQCLADSGLVIYGSEWCPACKALVETLGGDDKVKPVYVECTTNQEICEENKKTNYVPEIQFNGEVYEGHRTLEALSQLTGCKLY